MVRQNGKELSTVYRRSRVMDNVRSEKALLAEDHESWGFPRECYGLYKSAEVHTVKRSLSSKAKRGIVLALIAASLVGYAIWNGKNLFAGGGDKDKTSVAATGASATGGAALGLVPGANSDRPIRYASVADYAKAHIPRLGAAPWSAPVYDDRSITSDPQLYCMSSGQGSDGLGKWQDYSCTCLTEQGTAYTLSQAECRSLARLGPAYNPYKTLSQQQAAILGMDSVNGSDGSRSSSSFIGRSQRAAGTFPENEAYKTESYSTTTTRPGFM